MKKLHSLLAAAVGALLAFCDAIFATAIGGIQPGMRAYSGTTAGSTDRNPPIQVVPFMGGPGPQNTYAGVLSPTTAQSTAPYVGGASLWYYRSSDSATIASSPGYFTDGLQLGMKTGDVMLYVHQSSYGTSPDFAIGVLVTSNSTAGFNMAIGGVIQSS